MRPVGKVLVNKKLKKLEKAKGPVLNIDFGTVFTTLDPFMAATRDYGHAFGEPVRNQTVAVFQCTKCLRHAFIHEAGEVSGAALDLIACDGLEKNIAFEHSEHKGYSPEFLATIGKPWRAPSEKG